MLILVLIYIFLPTLRSKQYRNNNININILVVRRRRKFTWNFQNASERQPRLSWVYRARRVFPEHLAHACDPICTHARRTLLPPGNSEQGYRLARIYAAIWIIRDLSVSSVTADLVDGGGGRASVQTNLFFSIVKNRLSACHNASTYACTYR
jgi:hypothetical protein